MSWDKETGLTASDAAANDQLGISVACSDDGSIVVVGTVSNEKVYVYSGADWSTETQLTASDGVSGDLYGNSVACSADGSVIVVGAWLADSSGTQRGQAYVYSGASWATETILTASDQADGDRYGYSVSCSDDGTKVVVGAQVHNGDRGKAYVYSGTSWGTETGLTASDAAAGDEFGVAVAISGDGSTVVVGAWLDDSGKGSAYVYSGTSWGTETKLTASTRHNGDSFGFTVMISNDGSVVAAQAPNYDNSISTTEPGKVFVYSGTSWGTETGLTSPSPVADALFGSGLACSSDGSTIVVGEGRGATSEEGRVHIFSGTSWGSSTTLVASDHAAFDAMGWSVCCSSDAEVVVAGAIGWGATNFGKAYVFSPGFVPQIYRRL